MPRHKKCRYVDCDPRVFYFKPRGIPIFQLEEIILSADEVEALRLSDYEDLYHEEAAAKMGISRTTLGRILNATRHKIADAIINGKAIKIEAI